MRFQLLQRPQAVESKFKASLGPGEIKAGLGHLVRSCLTNEKGQDAAQLVEHSSANPETSCSNHNCTETKQKTSTK